MSMRDISQQGRHLQPLRTHDAVKRDGAKNQRYRCVRNGIMQHGEKVFYRSIIDRFNSDSWY